MESAIQVFKYTGSDWVETERLSEGDVGLLADRDSRMMFVWEGRDAPAKLQILAKQSLLEKKAKFRRYDFHSARAKGIPADVADKLRALGLKPA